MSFITKNIGRNFLHVANLCKYNIKIVGCRTAINLVTMLPANFHISSFSKRQFNCHRTLIETRPLKLNKLNHMQ